MSKSLDFVGDREPECGQMELGSFWHIIEEDLEDVLHAFPFPLQILPVLWLLIGG
jgi:hypothetical protein